MSTSGIVLVIVLSVACIGSAFVCAYAMCCSCRQGDLVNKPTPTLDAPLPQAYAPPLLATVSNCQRKDHQNHQDHKDHKDHKEHKQATRKSKTRNVFV